VSNTFRLSLLGIITLQLLTYKLSAQKDPTAKLLFTGYVDAYYALYTDSLGINDFQKLGAISPRCNQLGLNAAQLTAQYTATKVRATATLHYGDFARIGWSPTFNVVQEAHAGIRITPKLWLDAGFFRTHIGTEYLLPKDNIASSLSVVTLYEPYYQSGAKLSYTPTSKLEIDLFVLNGYNLFEDNNKRKSIGLAVTYALGDKGNINYANYIGDDTPDGMDSIKHLRFYNNVYLNYAIKKWKLQAGFDYGIQQNSSLTSADGTANMFGGMATARYGICDKIGVYGRGEIFNDEHGFLTGAMVDKSAKLTGLKMWGATVGVEYKPLENGYIRLEGRRIQMDDDQEIFHWDGDNTSSRMELLLNLGVTF